VKQVVPVKVTATTDVWVEWPDAREIGKCGMSGQSVRQTVRRAALDAQPRIGGKRTPVCSQERDRQIDVLAVEVQVVLVTRRRRGTPGRAAAADHMIDREQLSLRQAVVWLGDTSAIRRRVPAAAAGAALQERVWLG
jgi:hypothetical protein